MLIKYNRPNIHDAYQLKFYPGINNVDSAQWDICKKDSEIQRMLTDGIFEEIRPEVRSEAPALHTDGNNTEAGTVTTTQVPTTFDNDLPDLGSFNDKKAIDLIKSTYNYDILTTWKTTEKRTKVLKAIETQVNELAAEEASKKKEDVA